MSEKEITAYVVGETKGWTLEPAASRRDWMDQTPYKGANRCLPLVMANQAGWIVKCPTGFKATWSGKNEIDALAIEVQDNPKQYARQIASVFGSGIVTFSLPWLFRTPPGIGLLVRGPMNMPRPDAVPLDGYVETNWSPATFTMNWKLMKSKSPVWFRKDEPICHLMPYPLDLLESLSARTAPISEDAELEKQFHEWKHSRASQFRALEEGAPTKHYRLDYLKGVRTDGTPAPDHRTGLKLSSFDSK